MKKYLLIALSFLAFLTACDKEEDQEPVDQQGRFVVEVGKKDKDDAGNASVNPQNAIVYLWEANNREIDVAVSGDDINLGYAYDGTSGTYITAAYGSVGPRMDERIEPGRYFIYVLLPKSSNNGSLAKSYTYFEIKPGETLQMKKVFSADVASGQTEAWSKNN